MSNETTQYTPADVRGGIIRASILPIEDEETMIARLRAGAEAVERGELDAEDFAGIWSQYLRELFRRASSVPAPADVREQAKGAWATVEAAALAQANVLDSHYGGQRAKAAEIRNAVEQVAALLRTPRGEGAGVVAAASAYLRALDTYRKGCRDREIPLAEYAYDEFRRLAEPLAEAEERLRAALRSEAQGDAEALAAEILAELRRAREKFPGNNVMTLALVEEVGELAKATFEESRDRVRQEAIQVAVMAMRVVLDGDQTLDAWREAKGLDPLVVAARRGEGGGDGQ